MKDQVDFFYLQINFKVATSRDYFLICHQAYSKLPKTSLGYLRNISRNWGGINLILCMKINIQVLCKVILSFLVAIVRHAVSQITDLEYLCKISRLKGGMNLIFCIKINMKLYYRLMIANLVGMIIHAQSIQNNLFFTNCYYYIWWGFLDMLKVLEITSMQSLSSISRKNWVFFLHANKHQIFLEVDIIFCDWFHQACSKYPDKFAIFFWYSRNKIGMMFVFWMQVNLKVFPKLILSL